MRLLTALVLASTLGSAAAAEPAPDAAPAAANPAPVIVGWPEGAIPHAPLNFRVLAFARGLDAPRALLVLPNGDVLVSESRGAGDPHASADRVTLLKDTIGAGVSDQRFAFVTGIDRPVGLALRRDRLLIASTGAVLGCPFLVGQTRLHGECRALVDLPAAAGKDHWMRPLAVNADETRLFAGVGSSGDADPDYRDGADPARGGIVTARADGKDVKVFATGLRDPGGLAFEPSTGRLYATVSERVLKGGERVGDYLTAVQDGAFYGWPYSYLGRHEDPARLGQHPELVKKAETPSLVLPAGSHPRGLAFYGRDQMPKTMRGGVFIALAGSGADALSAGFKVVVVPFSNGKPAGPPEDFLTGFVKDATKGEAYGRPSAVAVATDGSLLVADEGAGVIWRVIFKCASCTPDPELPARAHERRVAP